MHQDLIRAKTGLPLDFEWLGGAEQRLKPTVAVSAVAWDIIASGGSVINQFKTSRYA